LPKYLQLQIELVFGMKSQSERVAVADAGDAGDGVDDAAGVDDVVGVVFQVQRLM